jgi:hypothetical protein
MFTNPKMDSLSSLVSAVTSALGSFMTNPKFQDQTPHEVFVVLPSNTEHDLHVQHYVKGVAENSVYWSNL